MIIVLKQGTTKDQISTFSNELNQTYGVTVNAWYGEHSTVLGLLGDTAKIDIEYPCTGYRRERKARSGAL